MVTTAELEPELQATADHWHATLDAVNVRIRRTLSSLGSP